MVIRVLDDSLSFFRENLIVLTKFTIMKKDIIITKKINKIILINIILSIVVLLLLFLVSTFWIGTQKQHEEIMNKNLFSFITNRLLLSVSFILGSVIILWIINVGLKRLFKLAEYNIGKVIIIETAVYILCSIIFVIIGIIHW